MRTKRHFFPAGEELVFLDGQFHTDESYIRRYAQHQFKDHYLILTGTFDQKIHDKFSIYDPGKHKFPLEGATNGEMDIEARFYIWHQYYEPRWDTGDVGASKDRVVNQKRNETATSAKQGDLKTDNSQLQLARGLEPSV